MIVTDGLKNDVTLIVVVIEIMACQWSKSCHFMTEWWWFQLTEVTPSGKIAFLLLFSNIIFFRLRCADSNEAVEFYYYNSSSNLL